MKVKVFSKVAWLISMLRICDYNENRAKICIKYYLASNCWVNKCEGLTKLECELLGFQIDDQWMIEKGEDDNEFNF